MSVTIDRSARRAAQRASGAAQRGAKVVWARARGARELPRALEAEHHAIDIALVGEIGYYADTHVRGRPLVLLHGIHAAASAYDMRPLFEAFRAERPVYAMDLPGFGTSHRGPNQYRPLLYARAIQRFLLDVVTPREEPVDVAALSLTSELVARVAIESPWLFRTITLISPTGLGSQTRTRDPRHAAQVERLLDVPLWASPIYRVLTSRPSVRYFLGKHFTGRVPRDFLRHAVRTARVKGAHHAPFAFLAGGLFTGDAYDALYSRLGVPTLVVYDRDPHTDFARLPALERGNHAIRVQRIPGTRGLPHFERIDEVVRAIREIQEEARRGEEAEARA